MGWDGVNCTLTEKETQPRARNYEARNYEAKTVGVVPLVFSETPSVLPPSWGNIMKYPEIHEVKISQEVSY